jgi:hypothetical protein
MTMNPYAPASDNPPPLVQAGGAIAAQLVRIVQAAGGNRYVARPVEFDDTGAAVYAADETLLVTNLAESVTSSTVPAGTDAIAVDVEGRWVIHLKAQTGTPASFFAKILSAVGNGVYCVRPQATSENFTYVDKPDASDVNAQNLAEIGLGTGTAVELNSIVLVTHFASTETTPGRFVFDRACYAKYLS